MDNELLEALLNVQPGRGGCIPNEHWQKLFRFYNSNRPAEMPGLGMSCQPCYDKVYKFCREKLLNQVIVAKNPPYNANVGMQAEVKNA